AEDGIRDRNVTGVQTCALPIFYKFSIILLWPTYPFSRIIKRLIIRCKHHDLRIFNHDFFHLFKLLRHPDIILIAWKYKFSRCTRSEERRVGEGDGAGGVRCEQE